MEVWRGAGFSALLGLDDFRKDALSHVQSIISTGNIRMQSCP